MINILDVAVPVVEEPTNTALNIAVAIGALVVVAVCIILIVIKNKKEK